MNILINLLQFFITKLKRPSRISETREILSTDNSEVPSKKLVMESLHCPYCNSTKFVKRGFRQKKRERVQLYLCLSCGKTFTSHLTRGKHYPLAVMLDAISIYNLGYSLEQTCRIVSQRHQKTPRGVYGDSTQVESNLAYHLQKMVSETTGSVKSSPHSSTPTPNPVSHINLQASTLATWVKETEELCRFCRMREFAIKKFSPKEMVITATLAHRQLYRFRFHRGKTDLIIREEYGHRKFAPLVDYLQMVPGECPHQYFSQGMRASETPLTFSKTAMIVRGKTNYATRLAAFVLQSVTDRKARHEAIQTFMLANDSVTVATEVPVYLTCDDLAHMKTQLGFQIFSKENSQAKNSNFQNPISNENCELKINQLPKLITGHIDLLQIRNGQIHILDYKPNAAKEQPIEQLTLYAMALSRLTGLRLFEFKCAWFDEKDYFEFYPLHVLHKPKRALRRRKVNTQEGTYVVNRDERKVEQVRPI